MCRAESSEYPGAVYTTTPEGDLEISMKRLPFAETTGSGGRFNQFQRVSTLVRIESDLMSILQSIVTSDGKCILLYVYLGTGMLTSETEPGRWSRTMLIFYLLRTTSYAYTCT